MFSGWSREGGGTIQGHYWMKIGLENLRYLRNGWDYRKLTVLFENGRANLIQGYLHLHASFNGTAVIRVGISELILTVIKEFGRNVKSEKWRNLFRNPGLRKLKSST